MAAFDDLAFSSVARPVLKRWLCPACDVSLELGVDKGSHCPTCDSALEPVVNSRSRVNDGNVESAASLVGTLGLGGFTSAPPGLLAALESSFQDAEQRKTPASRESLALLRRCKLKPGAEFMQNVKLHVAGMDGEFVAIPATFGARLAAIIDAPLTLAEPATLVAPQLDSERMRGCIVIADRGDISFVKKAATAQAAGALAVLCVQNTELFPFTPTDRSGEANTLEEALCVPLFAVERGFGQRLRSYCKGGRSATGKLVPRQDEADSCPICMEAFTVGADLVQLPCGHVFDDKCAISWLRDHNTCPVCRFTLPRADAGPAVNDNEAQLDWYG